MYLHLLAVLFFYHVNFQDKSLTILKVWNYTAGWLLLQSDKADMLKDYPITKQLDLEQKIEVLGNLAMT